MNSNLEDENTAPHPHDTMSSNVNSNDAQSNNDNEDDGGGNVHTEDGNDTNDTVTAGADSIPDADGTPHQNNDDGDDNDDVVNDTVPNTNNQDGTDQHTSAVQSSKELSQGIPTTPSSEGESSQNHTNDMNQSTPPPSSSLQTQATNTNTNTNPPTQAYSGTKRPPIEMTGLQNRQRMRPYGLQPAAQADGIRIDHLIHNHNQPNGHGYEPVIRQAIAPPRHNHAANHNHPRLNGQGAPPAPAGALPRRPQEARHANPRRVVVEVPTWMKLANAAKSRYGRAISLITIGVLCVAAIAVGTLISIKSSSSSSEGVVRGSTGSSASIVDAGYATAYSSTGTPFSSPDAFTAVPLGTGLFPPAGVALDPVEVWSVYRPVTDYTKPTRSWLGTNTGRRDGENVAVFWQIPRAGGSTMTELMGICAGLVQAGQLGIAGGHHLDTQLQIIQTTAGPYLNVDTSTPQGLIRAGPNHLHLLSSPHLDSITTPLLHETSTLFSSSSKRGKIFTLLRDPIERVITHFQYLQHATWDPLYHPSLSQMSLEDYATQDVLDRPEWNWMVKSLVKKERTDQLTLDDLNASKEILRSKVLIGLLEHKVDSLLRFELYFGWNFHPSPSTAATPTGGSPTSSLPWQKCQEERTKWETLNTELQDGEGVELNLTPGMPIYDALRQRNLYDVDLYEYAKKLFEDQRVLFQ